MAQEWYNRAELAMQKGEEDLARQALTRRQSYLESAHTMDTQLAQQQDVVAKLKENMRKLEAKITEAKTKKDLYIARARSAEASQRIQEMLGETGDTGMAAFSRMEDRVLELEAQSEALEELSRDPLESQFAALEQSAENAVDDEMAALRQRLTGEGGSQESLPQGPNPSN